MRINYYLSYNLSELVNYLDSKYDLELIQSNIHVLQVHSSNSENLHFIFELIPSAELQKYLKANEGKKVLVYIKNKGNFKDLPIFMQRYGLEYLELGSFEEFKEFLDKVTEELMENKDDEDTLMMKKKEEVFSDNQIWVKFLTCIPGVSVSKAEAICREYPNFTQLLLAYSRIPEETRPIMLKDIPTGAVSVGKVISGKIYKYINTDNPLDIL